MCSVFYFIYNKFKNDYAQLIILKICLDSFPAFI